MLIIMKKNAGEEALRQVKQYLVDRDFDFHQSTGANRVIVGVIGDTAAIDIPALESLSGVHVVYRIPAEE